MDNGMYNNNGGFNSNNGFDNKNFNNNGLNNNGFNNYNNVPQPPQSNGKAVAAMVLGICSIVFACLSPIIAIILGILAIVFAIMANKMGKTGMSTAGLITGVIGIILAVVMWIVSYCILMDYVNMFS